MSNFGRVRLDLKQSESRSIHVSSPEITLIDDVPGGDKCIVPTLYKSFNPLPTEGSHDEYCAAAAVMG